MKKIVVTGATSMIGRALIDLALDSGIEALAITHKGSPRADSLPKAKGIETIACGLRDMALLAPSGGGFDAFFHLAWNKTAGPDRDDADIQHANTGSTLDAVRLAHRLGCSVFVGAGSQAEYGPVNGMLTPETPCEPVNGYGIAKYAAGKLSGLLCGQLGIRHVWARILSVYGPGDGAGSLISYCITELLAGREPSLTPCGQVWDYLHCADAAAALLAMAESGSGVYCLGSGEGRPLREYAENIRDAINPALPLGFGKREYYPNQPMYLRADITSLTRDTGFTPHIPFAEGIRETINNHGVNKNENH